MLKDTYQDSPIDMSRVVGPTQELGQASKFYGKSLPVFSRDGDYLGRDLAKSSGFLFGRSLAYAGLGAVIVGEPFLWEYNRLMGIVAGIASPLIVKFYDRLPFMQNEEYVILNPIR